MEIVIKVAQLLLSLSILVILHEFGHFSLAKLFKTRVEKFYMFFNPWFSLFKFQKGETEYGVGWLPLGGYVKIAGMIDESMDREQMKQPPQPWEFRSKNKIQRLLIMLGGIIMNIILAFVIYIFTTWIFGTQYLPTKNLTYGIVVDSVGQEMGLQNGDQILSVDHKTIEDFNKVRMAIVLEQPKTIEVLRDGKEVDIPINYKVIPKLLKDPFFISARIPTLITKILDGNPAQIAGFKPGDEIVNINNKRVGNSEDIINEMQSHKNETVSITVKRNQESLEIPVAVNKEGKIGMEIMADTSKLPQFKTIEYSFFSAIPAGISKTINMIKSYLQQLKLIFTPSTGAYKSVGGFIAIGKIFPGVWDWASFWNLTAFLSIMLAVLNLLPIPALDGGHVMFVIYEIIVGKKPGDKFIERAQIVGMIIILALVLFANGNDIVNLFH